MIFAGVSQGIVCLVSVEEILHTFRNWKRLIERLELWKVFLLSPTSRAIFADIYSNSGEPTEKRLLVIQANAIKEPNKSLMS